MATTKIPKAEARRLAGYRNEPMFVVIAGQHEGQPRYGIYGWSFIESRGLADQVVWSTIEDEEEQR